MRGVKDCPILKGGRQQILGDRCQGVLCEWWIDEDKNCGIVCLAKAAQKMLKKMGERQDA